ncbi:MAG TPA: hypothetical protein VGR62_26230 [Candidatus Binatia bacterium]|jgi:hypothetical protein|nr:hypothetical protein [Candidatus Binatia bacterium]
MASALRLIPASRPNADRPPAAPTVHEVDARALVDAWVAEPLFDTDHAVDDLVARVARALARRDLRVV